MSTPTRKKSKAASLRGRTGEFLRELVATRGASPHTLRAYGRDLEELCAFLDRRGIDDPKQVQPRTLRGFLAELDERGLSRSTVQRKLSAVRSFFRHLLQRGLVDAHPAVGLRPARGAKPLPHALEESDLWSTITEELDEERDNLPALEKPKPRAANEPDGFVLFDSKRGYFNQIDAYREWQRR